MNIATMWRIPINLKDREILTDRNRAEDLFSVCLLMVTKFAWEGYEVANK